MCDLYENADWVDRVILSGNYGSRYFEIATFGGYPTAYVSYPEGSTTEDLNYRNIEIPDIVHEGITFFGFRSEKLMLGWDYGHTDDYHSGDTDTFRKKWDIPSIMKEIVALIDYLDIENEMVFK